MPVLLQLQHGSVECRNIAGKIMPLPETVVLGKYPSEMCLSGRGRNGSLGLLLFWFLPLLS